MKQYPSNLKYKKYHKPKRFYKKSLEKKNFNGYNGEFSLQTMDSYLITFKQIEACRRTLKRGVKKEGTLSIKLFTDQPIYKKSLASRMGKGKGNLSHWSSKVKKGRSIFEINGLHPLYARYVLSKSKTKLPIKSKVLKNIY